MSNSTNASESQIYTTLTSFPSNLNTNITCQAKFINFQCHSQKFYAATIYRSDLTENQLNFIVDHEEESKFDDDIKAIAILESKMPRIPANLAVCFQNVQILCIKQSNLAEISHVTLQIFENLRELWLPNNKLMKLPGDLFKDSPNLERISFSSNLIEEIGSQILEPLKKLKLANFRRNECIDTIFEEGKEGITLKKLKKMIEKFGGGENRVMRTRGKRYCAGNSIAREKSDENQHLSENHAENPRFKRKLSPNLHSTQQNNKFGPNPFIQNPNHRYIHEAQTYTIEISSQSEVALNQPNMDTNCLDMAQNSSNVDQSSLNIDDLPSFNEFSSNFLNICLNSEVSLKIGQKSSRKDENSAKTLEDDENISDFDEKICKIDQKSGPNSNFQLSTGQNLRKSSENLGEVTKVGTKPTISDQIVQNLPNSTESIKSTSTPALSNENNLDSPKNSQNLRRTTEYDRIYTKSPEKVKLGNQMQPIGQTSTRLTKDLVFKEDDLNSISKISHCPSTLSDRDDFSMQNLLNATLESEKETRRQIQTFNADLNAFLYDEHFKDFTIKGQKKNFAVHKFVIAARCPKICAMLKKSNMKGVEITEATDKVIEDVLEFIYDDKIPNFDNFENLLMIFDLAMKLDIERLSKIAEDNIYENLTVENAIEVLEIANKQDSHRLKVTAFEFVKEMFPERKFKEKILMEQKKEMKKLIEELKNWKRNVSETMEKFNKMGFFESE